MWARSHTPVTDVWHWRLSKRRCHALAARWNAAHPLEQLHGYRAVPERRWPFWTVVVLPRQPYPVD